MDILELSILNNITSGKYKMVRKNNINILLNRLIIINKKITGWIIWNS